MRRQLGAELGEDVELGLERMRGVEIELVAPLPAEGPSGPAHQAGEVDVARSEEADVLLREVLPDDRHHPRRAEEARPDREVRGRPAEHVLAPPEGRLEGVEGDGSDREERHGAFRSARAVMASMRGW